ncbi:Type I secretion outer membrane protein, TolC precursor [Rhodovulum sp. PH10]|uniref:TolC family outer membrane protein n=1 Tax=Rhodovulum sp. PH10 TaxID=1187851 RepID=UPI00027C2A15|nr:TolC family outer membrane protein [Rhodovulum sp. PH10]EJW12219.1 Type I secretion outer membrane protein, TolC precursor [Rhodovulum sp. PH10]
MTQRRGFAAAITLMAAIGMVGPARADTLPGALAQAYRNNPQLNAQRAIVRATDENVPSALSGYRPNITATATLGQQYTDYKGVSSGQSYKIDDNFTPRGIGITGTQTLFNGYQTGNRVRQAEGQVSAARETLRLIEQNVLLNGATAYMNLLRDSAILDLQRRNVEVLQEQLRQTRDRFSVGEVTRTDVAQSESRLAAGRSQVSAAESNYVSSKAAYRQVIGVEPGKLAAASPVDRLSPRSLPGAIGSGRAQNPNVTAAMFGIDVQALQVKINEGALLPTLTAQANIQKNWDVSPTVSEQYSASVIGQLSVPIYQGGQTHAAIRASKETLSQRRLDLETARDQAQATVVQAWGQLEAAKAQIEATQAQVSAAEIALNGVREEARVGQRTTLDVLNAQQELVNARVALVTAQRDRVVASYSLLAAVGRLSPPVLGLPTSLYDPMTHYQQVRDSWAGVRTPDGR